MGISASLVKELRERTSAGMMECKKALTETDGNIDKAIEVLRASGQAKADNKASRVATEGMVSIRIDSAQKSALMLEINCETDFVSKGDDFQEFCSQISNVLVAQKVSDIEALEALEINGESIDSTRRSLISKTGENIKLRRFSHVELGGDCSASYVHNNQIAVLVDMRGGDNNLAKDIAMHIAASKPLYINEEEVPADILNKEKEILSKQAEQENKPSEIIEKIVQGRLNKYLKEITLLGQPFVKDSDMSVAKVLDKASASVLSFYRYEIGEGLEKKKDNFVEEVMAQARGTQ